MKTTLYLTIYVSNSYSFFIVYRYLREYNFYYLFFNEVNMEYALRDEKTCEIMRLVYT